MNLGPIDWAIVVVAILALRTVSMSARRRMQGVADFLSANRSAGRYLLTIASQMGGIGAISFIAVFEMTYKTGLSPGWWAGMSIPVSLLIPLTGWVFYRFRETRALTMAQFFEMRYSRRFRIFAGFICWLSGVVNFGIFPAVAARFFIYFCGLPGRFHVIGLPFQFSTFATVMALDLGLALWFVLMGGQISVMITECAQGIFCAVAFLVVAAAVVMEVSWPQMIRAISHAPTDASMLNPFHTGAVTDFNVWYFAIGVFGAFYGYMSWQGTQGFYSSARSPHEQRMGNVIGFWRLAPQSVLITVLPLAALAVMRLPEYTARAALVNQTLATIPNAYVRSQMTVPIVMAHLLPTGIKGLLATIFLFFSFTCHDTYMHSWGSILVQDVVMPLRRKAMGVREHIFWLRLSIVFVAIFAFIFSLLYSPSDHILFFFAITGTIWLGGSGAVIIGGLYSRWGTTAGAYAALIVGAAVGIAGLTVPPWYQARFHHPFPVNGQWQYLLGMIASLVAYTLVSAVTGGFRRAFNLKHMLRRDCVAPASAQADPAARLRTRWTEMIGITAEFRFSDRVLAFAMIGWNLLNFAVFLVFSAVNLVKPISDRIWAGYWTIYLSILAAISVPVVIWFTIGGVTDIRALLKSLGTAVRDQSDDGRVIHEETAVSLDAAGFAAIEATEQVGEE